MRKKLTSVAAISLIALALGAWSAPTSFAKMLPHIVASNGSAPVVMGTNFTPGGAVVLTEWQVRKQKPLVKFHISADGNGAFTQFGQCDGNNTVRFQAKDVTTGHKSNKSSTSGVCIN